MYPRVPGHGSHIVASNNEVFHQVSRSCYAIPSICPILKSRIPGHSQKHRIFHQLAGHIDKIERVTLFKLESQEKSQKDKRTKVTNPALSLPDGRSGLSQPTSPGLTGSVWARPKGEACRVWSCIWSRMSTVILRVSNKAYPLQLCPCAGRGLAGVPHMLGARQNCLILFSINKKAIKSNDK